MKILVCGDFHISEKFDIQEIKRLLGEVTKHSKECQELYILGDIFHTNKPTPLEIYTFIEFLTSIKIPITMVVGNHDEIRGEFSSLDWIPLIFKNVTLLNTAEIIIKENIKILLGHYNITESVLGAYDYSIKSDVGIKDLVRQDIDLALLGHIHKGQTITEGKTTVIHPGSLFYIDFGEREDLKSLLKVTISKTGYKVKYIDIFPDKIFQFEFDAKDFDIGKLPKIDAANKIKIKLNYSDINLNKAKILADIQRIKCKDIRVTFVYLSDTNNLKDITKGLTGEMDTTNLLQKFYQTFKVAPDIVKLVEENLK